MMKKKTIKKPTNKKAVFYLYLYLYLYNILRLTALGERQEDIHFLSSCGFTHRLSTLFDSMNLILLSCTSLLFLCRVWVQHKEVRIWISYTPRLRACFIVNHGVLTY